MGRALLHGSLLCRHGLIQGAAAAEAKASIGTRGRRANNERCSGEGTRGWGRGKRGGGAGFRIASPQPAAAAAASAWGQSCVHGCGSSSSGGGGSGFSKLKSASSLKKKKKCGVSQRRHLSKNRNLPNDHLLLLNPIRCAIEPREFVGGIRKIAPLLERSSISHQEIDSAHSVSTEWKAVPDIWKTTAEKYGDLVALMDPHRKPPVEITFKQLEQNILEFAEGMRVYGIRPNETVALIADNSHRWLIADQGVMAAGAANAVRGARSATDELLHIIQHSDSVALIVDSPEIYSRLAPRLMPNSKLKFVIVLWGEVSSVNEGAVLGTDAAQEERLPMYTYEELLKSGQVSRQALAAASNSGDVQYEEILPDDVATLVYTSGTAGNPKGVMLTHANLLHQVHSLGSVVDPQPRERFLSLLPPWHMYERSAEYFALSHGVVQVYTSVKNFKEDLAVYPPDFFVAVPLVFDILYSGVQKKLGQSSGARKMIAMALINASLKFMHFRRIFEGRELSHARSERNLALTVGHWLGASLLALVLLPLHLIAKKIVYSKILQAINIKRAAISGGGSLSPVVDKFFQAIGINVLNGYGLTETSPVITARVPFNNVLGSVGWPIPETEIKVVDPETDAPQAPGTKGLVKVRGPQVMKGYYKNPTATMKAIDVDGWFDTGDLGWIAPLGASWGGGRQCAGALVLDGRAKDTIVLKTGENVEPTQVEEVAMQSPFIQQIVVVGQDQRRLGALIVVNKEHPSAATMSKDNLRSAIRKDLKKLAPEMQCPVGSFSLVDEPFTIESGLLTPTLKIKRDAVIRQYQTQVDSLFSKDSVLI